MVIEKNPNTALSLMQIRLFLVAPCLGKTTLASQDARFVDMDQMKSIYKYGGTAALQETTKGTTKTVLREDSFSYIQQQTALLLSQDKVLLFNAKPIFAAFLTASDLPYCLVYFHPDRLPELIEKMKNRGNPPAFGNTFTAETQWHYYRQHQANTRPAFKVELQQNEHLAHLLLPKCKLFAISTALQ